MTKDQQEPELTPLWGLKKKPLSNKPKKKRILETVNRMVSRIQNDERKYLWRNTQTRPVSGYPMSSKTRWPPCVTNIKSTIQTWCVVQSLSSFRETLTIQKPMGSWCSSDASDKSLSWSVFPYHPDIPRTLHPRKPYLDFLVGFFRGNRRNLKKVRKKVMVRCSVSALHRDFHPTDGSFDRKSHLTPHLPPSMP